MTGHFDDDASQVVVSLVLLGAGSQRKRVDAVVDTGFTGALMLPERTVQELGLPQLDVTEAVMADGRVVRFDLYDATIMWDDEEHAVLAYAGGDSVLLGVELLRGCVGTFEFFAGGTVTIDDAQ